MGVEQTEMNGGGVACGESEPPAKRLKLAVGDEIRARVLEQKNMRLKLLRDRFTEQLTELYFLQAGGNMMDYVAWRKRPPAPQLLAYLESKRPTSPPPAPAAPPALPAAPPVVTTEAPPAPTAPTAQPTVTTATPTTAPAQDEMVEKARQEAYVAQRVSELARAGLWTERRLPRVLEPPRPKTHWDYLLEEMAWLAQDFAHERKWKKQAAKKCARAVQKYFQDKAQAAQKAEKAQEIQLKKIAAFAAKEIRTFWSNVEKLVEWKRSRRVERARKEALDEQLSYIVDKTERYSRQLAAGLAGAAGGETPPSDEEFLPRGDSSDDERSIAAAERAGPRDHAAELAALAQDSRADLADLLPPGYKPARAHSDYSGDEDSADDETTIAAAERRVRPQDTAAELAALEEEADMDLEELRRRYQSAAAAESTEEHTPLDSDDDSSADEAEEEEEGDQASSSSEAESEAGSEGGGGLEALVGSGGAEAAAAALSAAAASLQPAHATRAGPAAATPAPRLLRHPLREYQRVGLHWLATMHARNLNGILADEMGLGKTIQTIALLAHLALERHDWGPHLVVVPTSVVFNWEMEFKKWCPAFKILTYIGTIKERKLKRVGWTKPNSFHVCITSYKLVVQDHQSFRRKRWKYLILDEAQNIKNFKSQRWQILLNFQTERRLLLTGTPLQNSLLELWSLMHFLMPAVFASQAEFREWFGPLAALAAGAPAGSGAPGDERELVRRLHEVLRPFLLRRLKADVERQMPRKYEHVLLCRLSKRQRCLYDDFMSRAKTRESLASGNLLSVINVLMQLRKVCNHPDLFEPRPTTSPLQLPPLHLALPRCVWDLQLRSDCWCLQQSLAGLEAEGLAAFPAHRTRHLAAPRVVLEELPPQPPPAPPPPPPAALRLHMRLVPRQPHAGPHPPPPLPLPAALSTTRAAAAAAASAVAANTAQTSTLSLSASRLSERRLARLRRLAGGNERRCARLPLYGADLRRALHVTPPPPPPDALRLPHHTLDEMLELRERWAMYLPGAVSRAGAGGRREARAQREAAPALAPALARLHRAALAAAVAFPSPRLLQYDCGKLQILSRLLRRLRSRGHRALIFTQMTRVLDVLEAWLARQGLTYLRLDGGTKPDQRQRLVDRFNSDTRVFTMLLSTRSGGVGLNLTGADAVIFYDSDWNPTMDAQAQDRAHRIGQTRDVHVYRLVTQHTVEENILRKAQEKRNLNRLAIEKGHFTTNYLKGSNIAELFGSGCGAGAAGAAVVAGGAEGEARLARALAAAEDAADAAAAVAAAAEPAPDSADFDDAPAAAAAAGKDVDPDAAEFAALFDQLSPVERYAMRMVESSEVSSSAERAALQEMRRQLHEWEAARAKLRRDSPPPPATPATPAAPPAGPALTYCREDSTVWESVTTPTRKMPIWSPPTPPAGPGDVYCEQWSRALYRVGPAPDSLLPAARAAPPPRRARPPRPHLAPPSLFERGRPPRHHHAHHAPPPAAHPPPDWSAAEDAALRRALRLQRLPPDPPPATTVNWEWCAELVGELRRAYRPPRACRDRHDRLADPARRKPRRDLPPHRRRDDDAPRPPLSRLDAMREAAERRRAAPRRRYDEPHANHAKQHALLADYGVHYDAPPSPMDVAARRADRIAKEKQKSAPTPVPPASVAAPVASSSSTVVAATASTPVAAPVPAATRIVVAHSAAPAGTGDPRRRAPDPAALQLYRQQALARQHLKILHQQQPQVVTSVSAAAAAAAAAGVTAVSAGEGGAAGGVGGAGGALRTLHLQQLALRRAGPRLLAPAAPRPHVVVAHLAPAAAARLAAPAAAAAASPAPAPAPPAPAQPPPPPTHHQQHHHQQ